jgi:serine/threonine-protein kinase OSR1/STK39
MTSIASSTEEAAAIATSEQAQQHTTESLEAQEAESQVDLTDTHISSITTVDTPVKTVSASDAEVQEDESKSKICMDEWPSNTEGYLLGAKIGSGAFAVVHHARRISNDTDCAVKIIQLEKLDYDDNNSVMEEIMMMRNFKHENVLTCHAAFQTRRNHVDELWIVMPFMNLGSALRVLTIKKNIGAGVGCGEQASRALLQSTLAGLVYLHDQGIVHRDIKAGNILLDSSGAVCIADFGVSSWLRNRSGMRDHSEGVAATFVGTPCWMAPEIMEQSEMGYKQPADVWSLGITALELAKGYAPYYSLQPMSVVVKTLREDPPSLSSYETPPAESTEWAHKSTPYQKIIKASLVRDPAKRDTCAILLKQKFVKITPSERAAALLELSETVGTIDVQRVQPVAVEQKTSSAVKKSADDKGTERSTIQGVNWDFSDVENDQAAAEFADAWKDARPEGIGEEDEEDEEEERKREEEEKKKEEEIAAEMERARLLALEKAEKEKLDQACASNNPDEFGALFGSGGGDL